MRHDDELETALEELCHRYYDRAALVSSSSPRLAPRPTLPPREREREAKKHWALDWLSIPRAETFQLA